MKLTAATITDDQIRSLQANAYQGGQYDIYRLCRVARGEVTDVMSRADARARCAELINSRSEQP